MELETGRIYPVRLCSGEIRAWRFEGRDGRGFAWWRDAETGVGFSEAGVLYAWELLPEGECDA
ncbi:hypothetical protein [Thauera linaloolentis]|uniref:Uncharacterized protein n=1 Tax=Thauera linaloolentis (strain DSM 12138 / JCM 21573 / CCUG 41526 / CIP 105981 / IAM 15112 / NBRC 102519 / 47Lol) TaxID=1123367 RepID=N6Z6H0_THAL4|nr:hypothetical protein [Thauera linaloolentis]ENO89948.1 hypothetical protein C666_03645 [Thauera linaloolentis 47Lol = DSM 12138]MCM8566625.1 hypothetical protein [Thauera linaloolentis]